LIELIDEKLNSGKITESASMGAASHPPRSGLVQRRLRQISQDLFDGEYSSILVVSRL